MGRALETAGALKFPANPCGSSYSWNACAESIRGGLPGDEPKACIGGDLAHRKYR